MNDRNEAQQLYSEAMSEADDVVSKVVDDAAKDMLDGQSAAEIHLELVGELCTVPPLTLVGMLAAILVNQATARAAELGTEGIEDIGD